MFRLLKNNQIANFAHDILIIAGVLLIPWFFSVKTSENMETLTQNMLQLAEVQIKNMSHDYVRSVIDNPNNKEDLSSNVVKTELNGSRYIIIRLDSDSNLEE